MSSLGPHIMSPSNVASKESRSPQFASGNASILLEKTKMGLRRSTPDSDALASSDDEQDPTRHLARITSQPLPKPTRRLSWITDTARPVNRKGSSGTPGLGLEGHSPAHTPDGNTWGSSGSPLARVNSSDNSYPWGSSSIWSNGSNSKVPPSRLSEMVPENAELEAVEEPLRSPGIFRRDSSSGGPIPFAIPLQPTLKAYRSQSYSVGQMEQELDAHQQARQTQTSYGSRTRAGTSYSGLQQRGSRPNMMGEHAYESAVLEQLEEVDDDDESMLAASATSDERSQQQLEREKALLRENNDLRQQLVNMSISSQQRDMNNFANMENLQRSYDARRTMLSDSVLEDVDDLADDGVNNGHYALPLSRGSRRMSEFNGNAAVQAGAAPFLSNRHIENVRRNHWQTSLGFGGVGEQSQSRRHSFADVSVPKRQISLNSVGSDFAAAVEAPQQLGFAVPAGFHNQHPRSIASSESNRQQFATSMSQYMSSPPPAARFQHHPSFEHIPHQMANPSRSDLYMVTFKASRAEFYYVPTGIGLEIKEGDLVIVEADRGTDLGTVVAADVPWGDTKKLREQQAEEHYRWLMMFSRRRQDGTISQGGSGGGSAVSPAGSAGGVGAAGEHALGRKEETDLKPKMIKRLAYKHEIQQLKEKEANEAKAKRICQAKADEHGLDMEILDAEFQMDWKKLTFYYFADAYINFNSLVTDLFKTYKTRIWMSAINPASFQTPPAALAPPSIIGPGAILPGSTDPRHSALGMHGMHGGHGAHGSHGGHNAGYVGAPVRGGYSAMVPQRGQANMGDVMQDPFWLQGQGLGANVQGHPGYAYDNMYNASQQPIDEGSYGRYENNAGRNTRDGQQSFAQHLVAQQQSQGQQLGMYGHRGAPY